ncbi:MAG TPA: monovalent cation/H(+) antiporter subunit G [Alphaproteobacteria bacterium]|nr:monovalent cation/H(+) antiporter subunit G [Alphaproteobacteria bacterium]
MSHRVLLSLLIPFVAAVLLLIGASFLLLAGVGMLRIPDVFSRMQASTKASTLGVACILVAVAVHFHDWGITMRALAASVFFLLTAPVSAHLVGRASYFLGVPLWEGTVIDELRGRYDLRTHRLASSFAGTVPSPLTALEAVVDMPGAAPDDQHRHNPGDRG